MILGCVEGKQVKDIANELGEGPNTIILWQNRFINKGVEGLAGFSQTDPRAGGSIASSVSMSNR